MNHLLIAAALVGPTLTLSAISLLVARAQHARLVRQMQLARWQITLAVHRGDIRWRYGGWPIPRWHGLPIPWTQYRGVLW